MCKPCLPGSYGINCAFPCSSLCLKSEYGSCRPADGRCTCLSGYFGVMCKEECPSDRYGPDCQHRCSCSDTAASCDKETGLCRCDPGQRNEQCLMAMSSRSDGYTRSSHPLTLLLFSLFHFFTYS
ncbi:multiple epidermal growth factor-like domains protein 11 [Asterias rubens]|uniref:multiple epidermal growth factor-like domains protein 11 n=1 Tax=Asterias rubens TaxID=7604 RepID=UPI0014555501|nr:multiple epidermal growth factor-like domains protein 11 [Asterias rubens]